MASDNPLSVNLPPVQWTGGTPTQERESDSAQAREKRNKKAQQASTATSASPPLDEAAPHEVDSFA
jgi:hypothetical protein